MVSQLWAAVIRKLLSYSSLGYKMENLMHLLSILGQKSPFSCFLEKRRSQPCVMARHQLKKMSATTLYRITSLASLRYSQSSGEKVLTEDSSLSGTLVESAFSLSFNMRPIFNSWDHYHCSVLLQDLRKSFRCLWQPAMVVGLAKKDCLFQKAHSHQRNY